jgi:multidrug efflux pump subunit AcrB
MLSLLINNAIRRPVTVIMLTILVLVLGVISISSMSVNFYPPIETPKLTVATSYPGLPAKETLELLTIPIEDALSSLQGLRHIKSSSLDGVSLIELRFSWGTDMKEAGIEAREMADIASLSLPEGASKPMVLPVNPTERAVMAIGVFPREGMDIMDLKRLCDREIKTIAQQAEGVGSIQVLGGLDEEILVEPDPRKTVAYGLTPQAISSLIQATNVEVPSGSIEQGSLEYAIKTDSSAKEIGDIENMYASGQGKNGSRIRLGDVARVAREPDDRRSFVSKSGKEGICLLVRAQGGFSPVTLSRNVRAKVSDLECAYGKTVSIEVLHDGSAAISESVRDLALSALLGFIVAFCVIFFYIRDLSTSLIMIASIPLSLITAIAAFPLVRVGINTVSLGGLAIGIGMLVDDSVVVLENIQRKSPPEDLEGVVSATLEIAGSTIGSTLTSLVVFLPLFFLPGIIGAVFRDLAWAVSLSIFFSFLVSVTVIPVLYRYCGPKKMRRVTGGAIYRKGLRFFFRRPFLLVSVSLTLLAFGFFCLSRLDNDWMSAPACDEYSVEIAFPAGTTQDYLMGVARALEGELAVSGIAKNSYCSSGGNLDDPYYLANKSPESEIIACTVILSKGSSLEESELKEWFTRALSREKALSVSVRSASLSFNEVLGLGDGRTVTFAATGETYEAAWRKAERACGDLREGSARVYPKASRTQILVTPDRGTLARMGLSASEIADALGGSVFGVYSGSIEGKNGRIPIRVRLPATTRGTIDAVREIYFPNPSGSASTLGEAALFSEQLSPPVYYRSDRQHAAYVDVRSIDAQSLAKVGASLVDLDSAEWKTQLSLVALLFSLSILLMYILLGIQFDSFALPLLMLAIIPFGFSGVFIALFVTGNPVNLNAILGSLVVIGFIVRNGIIFYDHYSSLINSRSNVVSGIYRGANDRIRPISISFLATLLALFPIAIDITGKNPERTMAIAIIGGLLFSSFLSLFIFPLIYRAWFAVKK